MRTTSLKILTTVLLLCVATSATLYYFRVNLLKATVNKLMLASELQIEEVFDVEFSLNHLAIKKLTVILGDKKLTVSLDDIALHYSLDNWQLDTVFVESATITRQNEQKSSPPKNDAKAALLSDYLSILKRMTLQRLEISKLMSEVTTLPLTLIWQREEETQSLDIEHNGSVLSLNLDYRENKRWRGNLAFQPLDLQKLGLQVLDIQFFLESNRDNHYLSITTALDAKTLAAIGDQYALLPVATDNISGIIPVQINTTLPDRYVDGSPISKATIRLGNTEIFFPDNKTPFKLSLIEPVSLQLVFNENPTSSFTISAEKIPLAIENPNSSQQAFAELSKLECQWRSGPACSLDYRASLNLSEITFKQYRLVGMNATLQGEIDASHTLINLTVIPGRLVSSAAFYIDNVKAVNPTLITRSGVNAQYNFDNQELAITADQFDTLLPQISTADFNLATQLTVNNLQASIGESLNIQFQLLSDSVNFQLPEQWLPALAIQTDVILQNNMLSASGKLFGDQKKLLLNFNGNHHLTGNHGNVAIATTEFLFDTKNNTLSSWFSTWPYQADLQGGSAAITTKLVWSIAQDQWTMTGTATQTLNDISGYLGDLAFVDLDFQHALDILSPVNWVSSEPGTLTLATFDAGVPITDISLRLSVDSKKREIVFDDVTSHLFGGTISSRGFTYHATKETHLIIVDLDAIHIEEIMDLAGYDDIQANGIIDGQLPISLTEQGISIDAGQMSAQSPGGVIRYKPESDIPLASGNSSMKLVTEALQYYQYDTMLADVRYTKKGDLALKIKMQGQNPDLNNGQQINLNLNIEDNIPMLLRSLQSGRVIADFVSSEMRK
ncbi:MAG: YdbH domain-containing protein [Oceanicoccus sp.]